jgi:glycosylphosphatidylinositol transamidase (GPIT) subunit GPI8
MLSFALLSFALAATLAAGAATDHWAVIVAGSNTYANYRHQADACHAYQVIPHPRIQNNPTLCASPP